MLTGGRDHRTVLPVVRQADHVIHLADGPESVKNDLSAGLARTAGGSKTGRRVVFLPGLGCERGQFDRLGAILGGTYSTAALDLPGHGESRDIADISPGAEYTLRDVAVVVADDLRANGDRGCVLVGHSAGGAVALHIAAHRAGLISAAVVLDANVPVSASAQQRKLARAERAAGVQWHHELMLAMAAAWGERDTPEGDRRKVLDTISRTPERIVRHLWPDVLRTDARDLWRRCSVPVLYIRSSRDVGLTLLRTLNPLVEAVDLSGTGCGHWPHLLEPQRVSELIDDFVMRSSSSRTSVRSVTTERHV